MFFLKELPTRQMLEGYRKRFPMMDVDAVESALTFLRQASLLLRELDAYFSAHNFSQLRFFVLMVIDREPECSGLTATQIASRLDVSKPVLTRTLQTLLGDEFIQFNENVSDKRSKVFFLTPSGAVKLTAVLPGYYRLIESFEKKHDKAHA